MYTLKQHKRKLKLRGLGPFVINSISPNGLVRLETLDGEPMANYINGSCLHVYNKPLTLDMLNRMHVAKNKKEAHQRIIKEAQEEAKEQVQKLCNKHQYINKVGTSSHVSQPIINVAVEAMHKHHEALLDSRAYTNILPLSIFHALKNKAKVESIECLYNFQRQRKTPHGSAFVNLYIQGLPCKTYFQVW